MDDERFEKSSSFMGYIACVGCLIIGLPTFAISWWLIRRAGETGHPFFYISWLLTFSGGIAALRMAYIYAQPQKRTSRQLSWIFALVTSLFLSLIVGAGAFVVLQADSSKIPPQFGFLVVFTIGSWSWFWRKWKARHPKVEPVRQSVFSLTDSEADAEKAQLPFNSP